MSAMTPSAFLAAIDADGFAVLPAVFPPDEIDAIRDDLTRKLQPLSDATAVRSDNGTVYAARNILTLAPEVATLWRKLPLVDTLVAVLGSDFGLVRTLYFDKPPERTWSLPWHKDLTIAVRENRLPSARFTKPTSKAGVPHVEAPQQLLEAMLFARIHLDDVTEENGPLQVIAGSHRSGKSLELGRKPPQTVLVQRGDVLLIRPLVAHCSGRSHPETSQHRRILHLEFAACPTLPDGYAWHSFVPA
jgi:hypothetical protein